VSILRDALLRKGPKLSFLHGDIAISANVLPFRHAATKAVCARIVGFAGKRALPELATLSFCVRTGWPCDAALLRLSFGQTKNEKCEQDDADRFHVDYPRD
jgi:hypothetical protein